MPHKHKRRHTADEGASFDLPPSSVAKPLPAFHKELAKTKPKLKAEKTPFKNGGKTTNTPKNDIPREFARLLNLQKPGSKAPLHALDDGAAPKSKKRKRDPAITSTLAKSQTNNSERNKPNQQPEPAIKIRPGERLADFSARVDRALPFTSVHATKGQTANLKAVGIIDVETRKTKHNRKLERMQKEWREEEARRKARREEEMEEREDEREEQRLLWGGVRAGGKKKKKRRSRSGKDDGEEEEDPWAELEKRRKETKQKSLQDVVQAPPQLERVRRTFKENGRVSGDGDGDGREDVPGGVRVSRKREEGRALRRDVLDGYKKMRRVQVRPVRA